MTGSSEADREALARERPDFPDFIDAHCHLADPRLDAVRPEVLARARARGVRHFIQGGVSPEDWERQHRLSSGAPGVFFSCFGLHPWWVDEHGEGPSREALALLPGWLDRGAVGLGELGLDHGPRTRPDRRGLQAELFARQLELAVARNLPLVLHVVRAHEEAQALLARHGVPARGGLVHAFGADLAVARRYLELGLTLSLGGVVARKGGLKLKEAVAFAPLDRLVIESDSPDQPPPGYAGRLNEPESLWEIAGAVGILKHLDAAAVLRESRRNLIALFRLELGS